MSNHGNVFQLIVMGLLYKMKRNPIVMILIGLGLGAAAAVLAILWFLSTLTIA